MKNIVSEDSLSLYVENLIRVCKQNAAISGTEYWVDLTQKLQSTVSVSNVSVELNPLKQLITAEIQKVLIRVEYT